MIDFRCYEEEKKIAFEHLFFLRKVAFKHKELWWYKKID